jgi:hypothetical protein
MTRRSFATLHGRMVPPKRDHEAADGFYWKWQYELSDHPASGVVMDRTKPGRKGCEGLRLWLTPFRSSSSMRRSTGRSESRAVELRA